MGKAQMSGWPGPGSKPREAALHAAFLLAAALAAYFFTNLRWAINGEYSPATLEKLFNGAAIVPMQYRALAPWAVRQAMEFPLGEALGAYRLFYAVELASLFTIVVAFRRYLSFFIEGKLACCLLSFTVLYALQFHFLFPLHFELTYPVALPAFAFYPKFDKFNLFYPSDMPGVAFFTVGLVLIYRRNWRAYYPLFIAATFNRETSCFLTVLYVITALGEERPRRIALHAAAQLAIWAGVKYYLQGVYSGNPGAGLFETKLHSNLAFLSAPWDWPLLFSSMGFVLLPTVLLSGRINDRFLRRSLLVLVPFFAGMMYVGNVHELRVFGDMAPVVMAAFAVVVAGLLKGDVEAEGAGRRQYGLVAREALFFALAAMAAYYWAHLRWAMAANAAEAPLAELARGTGPLPYQYRALIPWAVGALRDSGLPQRLVGDAFAWVRVYYFFEALSFFLLAVAFRALLSLYFRGRALSGLLALSLFFVTPFNLLYPGDMPINFEFALPMSMFTPDVFITFHPYETLSMAFFTAGLFLIQRGRWALYYPMFLVASFNSETIIFLLFVLVLVRRGRGNRAAHCAAHLALWGGAMLVLHALYRENTGSGVLDLMVGENLRAAAGLGFSGMVRFLSSMGFVLLPTLALMRYIKDEALKKSLLVLAPFFLWAFLFQDAFKLSVYGEVIPLVLAAFLVALRELLAPEG